MHILGRCAIQTRLRTKLFCFRNLDVQIAGTITGLLIYYAVVSAVARLCAARNYSALASFVAGVAATITLSAFLFGISSVYWGRVMFVNDNVLITLAGVIALSVLGGLRCRDLRAKLGSVGDT